MTVWKHRIGTRAFLIGLLACLLVVLVLSRLVMIRLDQVPKPKIPPTLSVLQVEKLAACVMKNTPEHIHFDRKTKFLWVALEPALYANPPAVNEAVMKLLREKYGVVYDNPSKIPSDKRYKDSSDYLGGFLFKFGVLVFLDGTVRIEYTDYEGSLAASGRIETYKWTGTDWEVIEKSLEYVS